MRQLKQPNLAAWVGETIRSLTLFPALSLYTKLEVNGLENLDKGGPYIFAANHASHLDTPLFLAALPRSLRLQIRIAAAADYFFDQPWKAGLVRLVLNAVPFTRRGSGSRESLEAARQLIEGRHSLLIFPEGTRSANGELHPFKWGIGWLAKHSSAQIIPVYIQGTHALMPKGARWPQPGPVSITFGRPLCFGASQDASQIAAEIEQQVRNMARPISLAA